MFVAYGLITGSIYEFVGASTADEVATQVSLVDLGEPVQVITLSQAECKRVMRFGHP